MAQLQIIFDRLYLFQILILHGFAKSPVGIVFFTTILAINEFAKLLKILQKWSQWCYVCAVWIQNVKANSHNTLTNLSRCLTIDSHPCHLARTRAQVVFYAAVFRAFDMAKSRTQEAIQSMQKGQLVLLGKNDPWWHSGTAQKRASTVGKAGDCEAVPPSGIMRNLNM